MMSSAIEVLVDAVPSATPIHAVTTDRYETWLSSQSQRVRNWFNELRFKPDSGKYTLVPADDGAVATVVLGLGDGDDPWSTGDLARSLPEGTYRLAEIHAPSQNLPTWAALAWALGAYRFARYKQYPTTSPAGLVWPDQCDRAFVERAVSATALARDLINTPAADMSPDALEHAVRDLALRYAAHVSTITGDALLEQRFPLIHAVGRASPVPPRLIDLQWGASSDPKVTLIGKGVCFDTGGLCLKNPSGMLLMKKDMGGAATMLGLACMIMSANLPVRLRLLIPAVENALAGNAYRPGDILTTRKGITVEVANTDAEGRLILADALTEAVADSPALIIDCATLTSACRIALGTEIPGLFANDEQIAVELLDAARTAHEPLCRLPLYKPYRKLLDSRVADLSNVSEGPHAGALTAALFLNEFVREDVPWIHLDTFAWNSSDRPGRPHGGEPIAMRALFQFIATRFERTRTYTDDRNEPTQSP
jgi:leucyl aminopeptidase